MGKTKKGKKRMKMIGKVEVPQEALLAVCKSRAIKTICCHIFLIQNLLYTASYSRFHYLLFMKLEIFISSIDQTMVIRNGADVLLRQLFSYFGLNGFKWLGLIFLISYLITFLIHKRKLQNTKLNLIYLPFMILKASYGLC